MQAYTETEASVSRFTPDDLANLKSLACGGPVDEARYTVRAAEDFLAEHTDMTTAEAVVELLTQIRNG